MKGGAWANNYHFIWGPVFQFRQLVLSVLTLRRGEPLPGASQPLSGYNGKWIHP